jgi:hypothetical protein
MNTAINLLSFGSLTVTVATCGLLMIGFGEPLPIAQVQGTALVLFMAAEIAARLVRG